MYLTDNGQGCSGERRECIFDGSFSSEEGMAQVSIYRQRVDEDPCYKGEYDHNDIQHEDGGAARMLVGKIE